MFHTVGIITIAMAVMSFLAVTGINIFLALLSAFFTAILGIAFIVIGDLINRVRYLEQQLNISFEGANSNSEDLPQRICPKCSASHDFDYPKCPNCKYDYNGH